TITYLSDTGCLEIQGASLVVFLNNIKPDMVLDIKDEQQSCRIHLTFPEDAPKDVFYETATGECQ
uniref:hypothetical protein n=1 Tax=Escherichia coli TaxID=562 RepID=UPI00298A042D